MAIQTAVLLKLRDKKQHKITVLPAYKDLFQEAECTLGLLLLPSFLGSLSLL